MYGKYVLVVLGLLASVSRCNLRALRDDARQVLIYGKLRLAPLQGTLTGYGIGPSGWGPASVQKHKTGRLRRATRVLRLQMLASQNAYTYIYTYIYMYTNPRIYTYIRNW